MRNELFLQTIKADQWSMLNDHDDKCGQLVCAQSGTQESCASARQTLRIAQAQVTR